MPARPPPTRRLLLILSVVLCALLLAGLAAPEALARVGGGQGYSGGRSSGGGGYSGGGGGGGGDGDGLALLIWLVIEFPALGIPLVLIVVGYYAWTHFRGSGQAYRSHHHSEPVGTTAAVPAARGRGIPGLEALQRHDRNFSLPLFIDLAQLVYVHAQQHRPGKDEGPLRPYLSAEARAALRQGSGDLERVEEVILGATQPLRFELQGAWVTAQVAYEANLTEVRGGRSQQLLCEERWRFRRRSDILSPGPARMRSLDCASCGSPAEPRADGRCPHCDAQRLDGQIQWEVVALEQVARRPLRPPELHLGGGMEAGVELPTRVAPDLAVQRRAFLDRHPGHDWGAFAARVQEIFVRLQRAWAEQSWEQARPYESDALFQVHLFWIERYRRFQLRNRLEDVEVQRVELAAVGQDAFLEAVTVRVFAQMRDWTEDAQGRVVAGSAEEPRFFSEYWTFIRTIGGRPARPGAWQADLCPSCGAPLDRVSMAGICGYCDAKITAGEFDWVLSRIEQDEAYAG